MSMNNYVVIIPARQGSKGIKNKNLQLVGGLSLVARAIEVAKEFKCISKVIVSTDGETIADEARKYGALIHHRSSKNSLDGSKSIDVINEVMHDYRLHDDICILLQPTSPLRNKGDVEQCISQYEYQNRLGSVVSISLVDHHPYKTLVETSVGLQPIRDSKDFSTPRQQLENAYRINGSIYIARFSDLISYSSFFFEPQSYVMTEKLRSIDIDDINDLRMANLIWKTL